MLKRITASLASLALVTGLGLATAVPAQAQTAMQNALCAADANGEPTVACGVDTNTLRIQEGDSLAVTVRGALDVTVAVALYAGTPSGIQQIGSPVEVTVQDDTAGTTVSLPVPVLGPDVLDGSLEGGNNFVVLLADATGAEEDLLGREVHVLSARAAINGQPSGSGTADDPFSIPLTGGITGDRYKAQALVDGSWIDFTTVDGDEILASGSTQLRVVSPEVEIGQYPVRLYNLTRDVAGIEGRYSLSFGVEPSPEPTPEPTASPSPSDSPSPTPTSTAQPAPSPAPTSTPSPTPTSTSTEATPQPTASPTSTPTEDDGDERTPTSRPRPGLPRTGVIG